MELNFFSYLRLLEIIAFFSGYPLIYLAVVVIAGKNPEPGGFRWNLPRLLPYGYAFIGTLYLGLQLKYGYVYLTGKGGNYLFTQPYLSLWGLLSVLNWLPYIAKNRMISLAHSMVFLGILIWDLFSRWRISGNMPMVHNDMNIYWLSVLLNAAALIVMVMLYFVLGKGRQVTLPQGGTSDPKVEKDNPYHLEQ